MTFIAPQSYPVPTWLPGMRSGEVDGRFMDCSPALNPISDVFTDIVTISIVVTRADGQPMTAIDLQQDPDWTPELDPTGTIATFGWIAPAGNPGADYILTLTADQTRDGRLFVRDWAMAIVPLMG